MNQSFLFPSPTL